ncbi:MAG: HAMP domain-containing histidine kinase [Rhizobiales bacterium]|nr:HAMP domain-containing histidine kinase [Hyphomicrobiales bacterium]MBI3673430.1 HAMP domain-containing histidine kinase [Hyphomicrobiales bacterium]
MAETARKSGDESTPGLLRGLSGKVLVLTVLFVMLGEVLIFLPAIANFRIQWLKGRIAQAEIAALAAEAAPDQILSSDLRSEILKGAGVLVVSLSKDQKRQLILRSDGDQMIEASYDLRETMWLPQIADAGAAMLATGPRIIGVVDKPPNMSGDLIEIALDEEPLRQALRGYGLNILLISVGLSLLVGLVVFVALNRVLVRPMQRLTLNMVAFGRNPEDASRIIGPSARRDEIGIAERELHAMQGELLSMLQQKNRLAALGLAVSKVSHDLRNMLSSAQLISDRLSGVEDPTVQRFAPKLIASLDRAIGFLTQTLKFGRAQEPPPMREKVALKALVDEVIENAVLRTSSRIVLYNNVAQSIVADADRDQLNRVLTNLLRNAIQAIETAQAEDPGAREGAVTVTARRDGSVVAIEIRDNGPGIPERIRPRLFEPFQSAARSGGTGLGLAIAAELVRAHGGEISLATTGPEGTSFVVTLPDTVAELRTGRRGERRPADA